MPKLSPPYAPQAVLFDLDGTLADTAPDLAAALNHVRRLDGLPEVDVAVLRPHTSSGARGLIQAGYGFGPEHADFERIRQAFLDHYAAHLAEHSRLFDGIEALLDALEARGVPWGVVTNKSMRFTPAVLQGLALADRAAVVIGGDTTPHSKPHPEPLLEACRRLSVAPAAGIYVGDDLRDVQAARAAGMPSVATAWGYLGTGEPPEAWGADHLIDHPLDLLPLLFD